MNKRKLNAQQTELRRVMLETDQHEKAISLFLHQHAMLHSAKMAKNGIWSYEDEIMDDMDDAQMRRIPKNGEHSVLWCLWHIARIEDVTMNLLIANTEQIFEEGNWLAKTDSSISHTANAMSVDEIAELSARLNIAALREYRIAVGQRTREIVKTLEPSTLKKKVDPAQITRVAEKSLVHKDAPGIIEYWRKRNIAGLLE
jgi:hypothetical protein